MSWLDILKENLAAVRHLMEPERGREGEREQEREYKTFLVISVSPRGEITRNSWIIAEHGCGGFQPRKAGDRGRADPLDAPALLFPTQGQGAKNTPRRAYTPWPLEKYPKVDL